VITLTGARGALGCSVVTDWWDVVLAVRNGRIVEIKSPILLQPGPAVLTEGLDAILAALWGAPPR
jgi:hypothetical protein